MTELYLSPSHRRMLEQSSGISPAVIAARGYRTVTGEEALSCGFSGQQARSGLLIPVHTTDGKLALSVLRPDQPRIVEDKRARKDPSSGDRPQKIIKYEWPQGVEPRVDCPPVCFPDLKDPTIPLWITEGQKKGDALASWGLCVIDLPGGVWGWKSKRAGVLTDLDYIVWTGRDVFVVFDSDVLTKPAVAQALGRLVKLLSRRGANVTPVPLPQQGDEKLGVDDFKAHGGTLEQLHSFAGLGQLLPLRTDSRLSETESAEYLKALAELGYDFTMNAIDDGIEVNGQPMTDPQRAEIRTRMRDAGYRHVNVIEDAYTAHAWRRQHHPVKDFLNSLEWDGEAHIARLAGYIETDHADLYRSVTGAEDLLSNLVFYLWLRRWLIGAVGKALDARQNLMLVLDGPQGIGKSHLVQWLGSILPAYFIEAPINPDDKDAWLRLMAKFIWEVGELGSTTRRADRDALKGFITTRMVTVRKPYGHFDTIKPALASLIGTINNESGFLTDPTGNRRFLICRLTGLDWGYVEKIELRQLWAEAVALYKQGEPWQPTPAEAQLQAAINEEYMVEIPLEMMLFKYFEVNPAVDIWTPAIDVVTTLEGFGLKGIQAQHLRELSNLMKSLGVQKGRPRLPGRPVAYRGLYRSNKK